MPGNSVGRKPAPHPNAQSKKSPVPKKTVQTTKYDTIAPVAQNRTGGIVPKVHHFVKLSHVDFPETGLAEEWDDRQKSNPKGPDPVAEKAGKHADVEKTQKYTERMDKKVPAKREVNAWNEYNEILHEYGFLTRTKNKIKHITFPNTEFYRKKIENKEIRPGRISFQRQYAAQKGLQDVFRGSSILFGRLLRYPGMIVGAPVGLLVGGAIWLGNGCNADGQKGFNKAMRVCSIGLGNGFDVAGRGLGLVVGAIPAALWSLCRVTVPYIGKNPNA